jgi:enolase
MKIIKVIGREIFDSRGFPTLECVLALEGGHSVVASVPSGASCGEYEAHELRDGGKRLMGKGVLKAIENLENKIAPLLVGKEPNLVEMDLAMIEFDGTENKSNLGANAILAASIALLKAQALMNDLRPYEFIADICGFDSVTVPYPMFNILNGGMHADSNLSIQEFMIMPIGAQSFRAAFEVATDVFHALKKILEKKGYRTCVGDEGGFAPRLDNDQQALDLIMEAINVVGSDAQDNIVITLDVAADTFYDPKKKLYNWQGKLIGTDDLIGVYKNLSSSYPIDSIEDGLCSSDWDGWEKMTEELGDSLQLVGDDLFATNPARIIYGIENEIANAAIIKPNQVGTITETLQSIKLCKEYGKNVVVSHRSGETNDTTIVDLAVGTSAGQIKSGSCCRGERMVKYNQLLRIEDELALSLLE